MHVSITASLAIAEEGPTFCRLADGRHVPTRHIIERTRHAADFVAIAERFVGMPYAWGGKTRLGVDCSGLVQVAMQAAGHACPRDSDMQQAEIGDDRRRSASTSTTCSAATWCSGRATSAS